VKTLALTRPVTPWKTILLSPNMWFIALGYAASFRTNFYLTWYPTYLREHLHLSLKALGFWGSVPLVAGMVGDVVGALSRYHSEEDGQREGGAPRRGGAGFSACGAAVIPAALTTDTTTSILCLAASFFFLEWVIGRRGRSPWMWADSSAGPVTVS